jgi:hypothetical protein
MCPKDSDNLSGARYTPASVRCALKGKILWLCCVKNPQIEFRMVANLWPHPTSFDLIWPGRFTAILVSYQKNFGLVSQYRSRSHWAWEPNIIRWDESCWPIWCKYESVPWVSLILSRASIATLCASANVFANVSKSETSAIVLQGLVCRTGMGPRTGPVRADQWSQSLQFIWERPEKTAVLGPV